MRAIRTFFAAALAAGALILPAAGAGAHEGAETQGEAGEILLPTRFPDTGNLNADAGWPGLVRRVYDLGGGYTDGIIGHVFDIDPATLGGHFDLQLRDDLTGMADLDIYFYTEMGDAAGSITPVVTAQYNTAGHGGEAGAIPPEARKGIVFMRIGVDATFTYIGYAPDEVHITADGYDHDITIQAGQTLVWVNDDSAGHGVTSDETDVDGNPLFDSSPKMSQPLVEGATFRHQFLDAGTYSYYDKFSAATATVNVVGTFGFPA